MVQVALGPQISLWRWHSLMSTQIAPVGSNPDLHVHDPAMHSALLVQSKSELHPVLTSPCSQPYCPSPSYPAGHSHP